MEYDDFPILNSKEYEFINQQYLTEKPYERRNTLMAIINELSSCINLCAKPQTMFNQKIRTSIENANKTLIKVQDNLVSTFNLPTTPARNFSNFDLFAFINKLLNLISSFLNLSTHEQKEYYKKLEIKNCEDIINSLKNIFSAMENSTLYFFKHM